MPRYHLRKSIEKKNLYCKSDQKHSIFNLKESLHSIINNKCQKARLTYLMRKSRERSHSNKKMPNIPKVEMQK